MKCMNHADTEIFMNMKHKCYIMRARLSYSCDRDYHIVVSVQLAGTETNLYPSTFQSSFNKENESLRRRA